MPSRLRRASRSSFVSIQPSTSQIHRPATGRPDTSRSRSPRGGGASGRRDSRCGSPRPAGRPARRRRSHGAIAKVAALSIHISGVWIDHAAVHAERERDLHRLDGVVAAVGIAGEIGLAHAGDQVLGAAAIGERAGEGEERQIAAGHEGGRQAVLRHLDGDVAGERGLRDRGERVELDHVVVAEPRRPFRAQRPACARGCAGARRARRGGAGRSRSRRSRPRVKRSSAQARQTVESCPPENSTSAVSPMGLINPISAFRRTTSRRSGRCAARGLRSPTSRHPSA